ncbi:MAG: D-serine ammonia-lyase [Ginsengibacter sp.]|jgi:D-serine dehydratase
MAFKNLSEWIIKFPILEEVIKLQPVTWINPDRKKMQNISSLPLNLHDMEEAEKLWHRFAPYLIKVFPETRETNGIIESPLKEISYFTKLLNETGGGETVGKLFLKCDNSLPVAGSIKARGGFYEVLHYAEQLALEAGLIKQTDNYSSFTGEKFRALFSQHVIGVGSTGNLGLSIGIMSAQLGFQVSVYMSSDAKEWKKNLLRSKGAKVIEFKGDFGEAVNAGRRLTIADPRGYFVDDENSKNLFLGYSVAAFRLKKQLEDLHIQVDADHPLFVYSPCGVGGSPGGVAFGLRQIFGDHAHCFFVEPTHSPSVLLGLVTGKMEKISVHDFGIDNMTEADGLAVGRPSAFATDISKLLISGIYTLEDDTLFKLLYLLAKSENIFLEPSATAGLIGPQKIIDSGYIADNKINPANITHIAWATGGDLVPKSEMDSFYEKGERLNEQVI